MGNLSEVFGNSPRSCAHSTVLALSSIPYICSEGGSRLVAKLMGRFVNVSWTFFGSFHEGSTMPAVLSVAWDGQPVPNMASTWGSVCCCHYCRVDVQLLLLVLLLSMSNISNSGSGNISSSGSGAPKCGSSDVYTGLSNVWPRVGIHVGIHEDTRRPVIEPEQLPSMVICLRDAAPCSWMIGSALALGRRLDLGPCHLT